MKRIIFVMLAMLLAACSSPEPAHDDGNHQHSTSTASAPKSRALDCAKAASDIEKLICGDKELLGLDHKLADVYSKSLAESGANKAALEAKEREWITKREDCRRDLDRRLCVLEAYQTRLVELQIDRKGVVAGPSVTYKCNDPKKLSAVYYNKIDPPAMVLTFGSDKAILIQQKTGSGVHYSRSGVDYKEHQGTIHVDFYGTKLNCTA